MFVARRKFGLSNFQRSLRGSHASADAAQLGGRLAAGHRVGMMDGTTQRAGGVGLQGGAMLLEGLHLFSERQSGALGDEQFPRILKPL